MPADAYAVIVVVIRGSSVGMPRRCFDILVLVLLDLLCHWTGSLFRFVGLVVYAPEIGCARAWAETNRVRKCEVSRKIGSDAFVVGLSLDFCSVTEHFFSTNGIGL